jgi:hypothetical protein
MGSIGKLSKLLLLSENKHTTGKRVRRDLFLINLVNQEAKED